MNQTEIIKKLIEGAKNYKENLQNKNLFIVYRDKEKVKYIEVVFLARNFMHLTGIRTIGKEGKYKTANQFYQACLNYKLSNKDICVKEDGTTKLKLDIMDKMIHIEQNCKMIGMYNDSKKELITEVLLGNIHMCLGIIKGVKEYYIPNTLLKQDIRKLTIKTYPIIGIWKKNIKEKKYQKVVYINKKIEMDFIQKNIDFYSKIKMEKEKK